jgi:DNA excision repair protein ERCC-2
MGKRGVNYTIAVRALCEFTARRGDLDLRFTPSPTALEGIAGHATVASRRSKHYEAEVSLQGEYKTLRTNLQLRGRADGYDPQRNRVEEIKTFRGDFRAIPDNHRQLHWAQVKVYGWLLCQSRNLQQIELALVYFDIGNQKETVLAETHSAADLRAYFERQCEDFLSWAEQETAHRNARDSALAELSFPHPEFRQGQRHLAESVYRSAASGRCLLAQAPTGIGKTIGTLFPLLKACPGQGIDKIFFLTAKTSGRSLALDAIDRLRRNAFPLRILELTARDKTCEHPDKACHGASCPLAHGFYDRLAAARQAAVDAGTLDQPALRNVALAHQVCPYYLGQELAKWSDVVIGDYNYYFDTSAMLYALTVEQQWRVGLLVDEAHNMIDRARMMYSAELDQTRFCFARHAAPKQLKRVFDRVHRLWNALHQDQVENYQVYHAIDSKFLFALQQACAEIADAMAEHPDGIPADVQNFYFDALHFSRLAESFGEHSLFDISLREGNAERASSTLCIRNVVPAPFLQTRFAAAQSATLFSATLSPWHFHADMLGLPDNTVSIDVESPFSAQQLQVNIAHHISTRYQHRDRSLQPIADLMAKQYRAWPGNYLAFFSSFDYLQKVENLFVERHPDVPRWQQARGMDEKARADFLQRFTPDGRGIGFAVLGGAFAEGIDLPGDRLIGAFIATLGLPQINPVNEQMRERMEALFSTGYDYTYLYPGLQKVVQAAGRVIRTQQDRGVIHLIDDRYADSKVLTLLPSWWQLDR